MCRNVTAPTSAFSIACRSAILIKLSDSSVPASSCDGPWLVPKPMSGHDLSDSAIAGASTEPGFQDEHLRRDDLEKPHTRQLRARCLKCGLTRKSDGEWAGRRHPA
jgi:hypothetical protein